MRRRRERRLQTEYTRKMWVSSIRQNSRDGAAPSRVKRVCVSRHRLPTCLIRETVTSPLPATSSTMTPSPTAHRSAASATPAQPASRWPPLSSGSQACAPAASTRLARQHRLRQASTPVSRRPPLSYGSQARDSRLPPPNPHAGDHAPAAGPRLLWPLTSPPDCAQLLCGC
jgi:hypothetical protein